MFCTSSWSYGVITCIAIVYILPPILVHRKESCVYFALPHLPLTRTSLPPPCCLLGPHSPPLLKESRWAHPCAPPWGRQGSSPPPHLLVTGLEAPLPHLQTVDSSPTLLLLVVGRWAPFCLCSLRPVGGLAPMCLLMDSQTTQPPSLLGLCR